MSLKSFVTNVWKKLLSSVKKTYKKVDELANKLCPVAIDVVEAMKKINDGFVGDVLETIVTAAIPGNKDDIVVKNLRAKLKDVLPKIITHLTIINSIAEIEDENEKLKAILVAVNLSPDETKKLKIVFHGESVLEEGKDVPNIRVIFVFSNGQELTILPDIKYSGVSISF